MEKCAGVRGAEELPQRHARCNLCPTRRTNSDIPPTLSLPILTWLSITSSSSTFSHESSSLCTHSHSYKRYHALNCVEKWVEIDSHSMFWQILWRAKPQSSAGSRGTPPRPWPTAPVCTPSPGVLFIQPQLLSIHRFRETREICRRNVGDVPPR
jgi:hypothetical protein